METKIYRCQKCGFSAIGDKICGSCYDDNAKRIWEEEDEDGWSLRDEEEYQKMLNWEDVEE